MASQLETVHRSGGCIDLRGLSWLTDTCLADIRVLVTWVRFLTQGQGSSGQPAGLCADVSGGQRFIFTSGHKDEAMSSWEFDTGCRVLMARGTGDPQGRPEAGHINTECDNIARHLTLFADL